LDTNLYVIVYALDFSKAFDSVLHSAVLDKYSRLMIPDNWIESFFCGHMQCTRFGDQVSHLQKITASIIQGSAIGPASYVVTASDLHPVTTVQATPCMNMQTPDDTYLAVPAANVQSCAAEIANVELWVDVNNLKLNRNKSSEIVFVPRRSRRALTVPPPAVEGLERVESIKARGVTISRHFSVAEHVDNLY
jgi:Reverse transcriptase (RNA-dependent DNA polymerase)